MHQHSSRGGRHAHHLLALAFILEAGIVSSQNAPIVDAHIHYSHDTWSECRRPTHQGPAGCGREKALVSSSSDDGTQMLLKEAPDLIVPVLRPYRRRGEISTWVRDPTIIAHVEGRLEANTTRHWRVPCIRRGCRSARDAPLVELAKERKIFLHAHSDPRCGAHLKQDPGARVLWAHSGFDQPDNVRAMLAKHKSCGQPCVPQRLRAWSKLDPRGVSWCSTFRIVSWLDRYAFAGALVLRRAHAEFSRKWLADLPSELRTTLRSATPSA